MTESLIRFWDLAWTTYWLGIPLPIAFGACWTITAVIAGALLGEMLSDG